MLPEMTLEIIQNQLSITNCYHCLVIKVSISLILALRPVIKFLIRMFCALVLGYNEAVAYSQLFRRYEIYEGVLHNVTPTIIENKVSVTSFMFAHQLVTKLAFGLLFSVNKLVVKLFFAMS